MRDPKERLRDILDAIAAVGRYRDRDKAAFERDELLQVWFLRHLQIIGGSPGVAGRHPCPGARDFMVAHHRHAEHLGTWVL